MPAELPSWYSEDQFFRRQVLNGAIRIIGATGTIPLVSLLAACERPEEKIEIPKRTFNSEFVRWIAEQEDRETVYFLAQVKNPNNLMIFVALQGERAKISTLDNGNYAKIFEGNTCQLLDEEWVKEWFPVVQDMFGITVFRGLCGPLFPVIQRWLIDNAQQEASKIQNLSLTTIKDGSLVNDNGGSSWLLSGGRRYQTKAVAAEFLATHKSLSMPKPFIEHIPESENKLNFGAGDLLVGPSKNGWYLRDGARYRIRDTDKFRQNTRFNRKIQEVPDWVIQKIPIETEVFDGRDWDGHQIDEQPDGGLMILFCGGYSSNSQSQKEIFVTLKEALKRIGWRNSQFLEFTYNFSGNIPQSYTSDHTYRSPLDNDRFAKKLLEWYKKRLPRMRFILVGHSQGGYLAFNAALDHIDAVETLICINSPLTGIGRYFDLGELAAQVKNYMGDEPARYFIQIGKDPSYKANVELFAQKMKERGVKLFSVGTEQDSIVEDSFAILTSSDNSIDGYRFPLLWKIEPGEVGFSDPLENVHSLILKYPPFIVELVKVIGRP